MHKEEARAKIIEHAESMGISVLDAAAEILAVLHTAMQLGATVVATQDDPEEQKEN